MGWPQRGHVIAWELTLVLQAGQGISLMLTIVIIMAVFV